MPTDSPAGLPPQAMAAEYGSLLPYLDLRAAGGRFVASCVFRRCWPVSGDRMGTLLAMVAAAITDEREAIAEGLRTRDGDLLGRLISEHQHRLFRYLVHLTGSPAQAEDLFQETWLRVIEKGHRYDPSFPFVAWLFTLARNLTLDSLRRLRPASLEALTDPADGDSWSPPGPGPSPFEALLAREQGDRLAALMAAVPALYREVLVLRFQEELALDEIAAIAGAPLSTVKSRLYRGLRLLADRLGGPS